MICGNTQVSGALFNLLQNSIQYAYYGPQWFVLALIKPALTIKVAEKFIGAVNEVNHHGTSILTNITLRIQCRLLL
jgi:hypothetical protein